ncbi:MAG: cation:proton antiporter [Acidobacteria bacterium]|nr:cation:proton antiporter [Acidobacteriota bacterium]
MLRLLIFCAVGETTAFAAGPEHSAVSARIFLSLAIILISAKFFSHVAERLKQPPVLGELVAGVIIGNLTLLGFNGLEYLKTDEPIELLAQVGVILLLFEVGLESTVTEMMRVGWSSFLVAMLGVAGPFALGWGVGAWLLPEQSVYVHAFLGATLTATSVGITARVLKDLGRSQSAESRVILGAAVIDDVLGLLILAVVTNAIIAAGRAGTLSFGDIGMTVAKATVFLAGGLWLGIRVSRRLFGFASKLQTGGVLLATGLAFCFFFAWLSTAVGLAAIVGAFTAGLILEELHYRDFKSRGEHGLEELVAPIASFLVPIFFVSMGIRTDLRSFASLSVLQLAAVLTIAAILGKQLSSLGVLGKGVDRLSVGIGMIPRGEVGLIFANAGLALMIGNQRVVNQHVFSAVVVMVIATTILTPPALKWSLERKGTRQEKLETRS